MSLKKITYPGTPLLVLLTSGRSVNHKRSLRLVIKPAYRLAGSTSTKAEEDYSNDDTSIFTPCHHA